MKSFMAVFLSLLIFIYVANTQPSFAQEKKEKTKKEVKKEDVKKEKTKRESGKQTTNEFGDDVAGKTKDGKIVYAGPKGGFYYLTSGGNKSYIKENELIGAKVVGKTKDGKNIYEGPRGGYYYYNSNNEKTYVKKG